MSFLPCFRHRGSLSTNVPSESLAQRGNFLNVLHATTRAQASQIIDSSASDHITGTYHFLTTYSPGAANLQVKIADGSLPPVAGKGSIHISASIILEPILHVPKLSCNLLSISQLTKTSKLFSQNSFPLIAPFKICHRGRRLAVLRSARDSTTLRRLLLVTSVTLLTLHLSVRPEKLCYDIIGWVIPISLYKTVVSFYLF